MQDDRSTPVAALRETVRAFVAERGWEKYHTPRNLAASVAVEAGELLECFQWLTAEEAEAARRPGVLRDRVADEVADVLAYLLALANVLDLDVASTMKRKFEHNRRKYPPEDCQGRYVRP